MTLEVGKVWFDNVFRIFLLFVDYKFVFLAMCHLEGRYVNS